MKTISYILLLLIFFSCNKSKKNETSSVLSGDISQQKNSTPKLTNDFINKVKELPIEKFPFDFIDCDINELNELEKSGPLETILNIKIDSLIPLNKDNDTLFYPISVNKINNNTFSYSPKYYYFLIENKEKDTSVSFSNSYIFKRLKRLNEIEVVLIISKIYDVKIEVKRVIGTQIDLLTYNIEQKKSIDRERLITVGIGLEDIAYYECFNISSNYEIQTKSFMHLEDESTSITRKLSINTKGEIIVSNPKIIVTD